MSGITTHVLDTSLGKPGAGVAVRLESQDEGGGWKKLGEARTDENGRAPDLTAGAGLKNGPHRIVFETGDYFEKRGAESFYPHVEITFIVRAPDEHHHVPLLISPFGYSTYRGS